MIIVLKPRTSDENVKRVENMVVSISLVHPDSESTATATRSLADILFLYFISIIFIYPLIRKD